MSKDKKININHNDRTLLQHPYYDEFLQTMTNMIHWLRWVGVAGSEGILWKLWGFVLLCLLLAVEGEAIWKVVKALAGWAIDMRGHRSVTARLAGTMFYSASLLCLIQCWRLSCSWKDISKYWASIEWTLSIQYVPRDKYIRTRMYKTVIFVAALSSVEHLLDIISSFDFNCQLSLCFRTFILKSHGFLILEHEYSDWIAVFVFITSIIATVLWNLRDLIIILTSMGLSARYKRLNEGVKVVTSKNNKVEIWNKVNNDGEYLKVYMWRKIREAYAKQSMLVRKVDNSLGTLILLSAFFNFYFICLQLFLRITPSSSAVSVNQIYHTVSLSWVCIRTGYTVLAAAEVNKCSTLALPYLYECSAQYYNVEIERLQKQLSKDYVALTGMGFFYLNRTFVLQMAGAVVTFVLVLIQYDDSETVTPTNSTLIG
ncbi:gustatory receptor for sugar taste 64a-like [Nymphalis io]|uniref:gustatory receptor for sugar taste 64a-like n=1 Tax=Inachis io TaxID=171585 RepID=UPI0021677900|nr:gustatory receptor for sugar taste 64a-like [Nymphalis io]